MTWHFDERTVLLHTGGGLRQFGDPAYWADTGPTKGWQYTSGGNIQVRANWDFYSFCNTGLQVRIGLYYRDWAGQPQVSESVALSNGQQYTWKDFWIPNPDPAKYSKNFPAGVWGFYARTYGSGCNGTAGGVDPAHGPDVPVWFQFAYNIP